MKTTRKEKTMLVLVALSGIYFITMFVISLFV